MKIVCATLVALACCFAGDSLRVAKTDRKFTNSGSSKSEPVRPMIITQASDTAIPLVTNAEGVRTRIAIINLDATAATYQIVFATAEGTTFNVPWADREASSNVRGTVEANSVVELVTTGSGDLVQGFALASATGARVVFQAFNEYAAEAGGWNALGYYPGNSNTKRQKLRFDNREGYASYVLVNNLNTARVPVTLVVRDADGKQLAMIENSPMDALAQYTIDFVEDFPATAGISGTIEISIPATSRAGLSALGVRYHESNNGFNLFDAFSTVAWSQ